MKRWRALLRLSARSSGTTAGACGRARDLARALGGARDVQAALDALADLPKTLALSATLATVRGRLKQPGRPPRRRR
jgi:hypothetical protein